MGGFDENAGPMAERRKQRLGLRNEFLQALFRPGLAAAGNEGRLAAPGLSLARK